MLRSPKLRTASYSSPRLVTDDERAAARLDGRVARRERRGLRADSASGREEEPLVTDHDEVLATAELVPRLHRRARSGEHRVGPARRPRLAVYVHELAGARSPAAVRGRPLRCAWARGESRRRGEGLKQPVDRALHAARGQGLLQHAAPRLSVDDAAGIDE